MAEEDWHMPLKSYQYLLIIFFLSIQFFFINTLFKLNTVQISFVQVIFYYYFFIFWRDSEYTGKMKDLKIFKYLLIIRDP